MFYNKGFLPQKCELTRSFNKGAVYAALLSNTSAALQTN